MIEHYTGQPNPGAAIRQWCDALTMTRHVDPPGMMMTLTRSQGRRVVSVNRIVAHRHVTDELAMRQVKDILADRLDLKWRAPAP